MHIPARKIKKSAVKNIVRFPAIKSNGGKSILLESILEYKFCLYLEFDPLVVEYYTQPQTFELTTSSNVFRYTPDFLVKYKDAVDSYIEVKPQRFSKSEHFQHIFTLFDQCLINKNACFKLVDEEFINCQPLLSNYEKLYRHRKRPSLNLILLHRVASEFDGRRLPLKRLIQLTSDEVELKEIYSWLAFDYLTFDIMNVALNNNTEVSFNVF